MTDIRLYRIGKEHIPTLEQELTTLEKDPTAEHTNSVLCEEAYLLDCLDGSLALLTLLQSSTLSHPLATPLQALCTRLSAKDGPLETVNPVRKIPDFRHMRLLYSFSSGTRR